ncbi:MAG: hypothetical protein ACO3GZ_02790 [Ilumatobacteraceae bacterium]
MNTRGDSGFEIGDDEFRDHEISSLLNQVGGDAPAVGPAHQMVLGRVRTIRRRRTVASSVGALVAVLAVGTIVIRGSNANSGRDGIALDPRSSIVTTPDGSTVTTPDGTPVTVIIQPDTTSIDPSNDTPSSSTTPSSIPNKDTNPPTSGVPVSSTPGVNNPTEIPEDPTAPSSSIPVSPITTVPTKPSTPTTSTPVLDPPTSTIPPTTKPVVTPPTTKPVVTPPTTTPEREIVQRCAGGAVIARLNAFGVFVKTLAPADGFSVESQDRSTEEIRITFKRGNGKSKVRWQVRIERSGSASCRNMTGEDTDADSKSESGESSSAPDEATNNNGGRADD